MCANTESPPGVHAPSRRAHETLPSAVGGAGAASPLYTDWAKPKRADGSTKGIAIAGPDIKPRRVTLDELLAEFPPPRQLRIEGIPTIRRDELIDAGYDVFYCNTRELANIRRAHVHETNTEAHPGTANPSDADASAVPSNTARAMGVRSSSRRASVEPANADAHLGAANPSDADASVSDTQTEPPSGVRSPKGDLKDAADLYRYADQIRWYHATRTEPEAVEAMRLFQNRDLVLGLSKLAAQHASSESYRDSKFFESIQVDIDARLKEASKAIEKFCRATALHNFHVRRAHGVMPSAEVVPGAANGSAHDTLPNADGLTGAPDTYGLSCLLMVAALARRPWIYGRKAWRHLQGVTAHAWHAEHAQMRSAGCDITLKQLIHGAVQVYLKVDSPYRAAYDEAKARFEPTVKHGKPGHGSFKVTPHDKAFNRAITTPVIDNLRTVVRGWFDARCAHDVCTDAGPVPSAASLS